VVFCFVIGNGDAHIRDFSVVRERDGFVQMAPAYDLLCTRVHLPNDNELGLGLLAEEETTGRFSPSFERLGFYSQADFIELGKRLELPSSLVDDTLRRYFTSHFLLMATALVGRSYLSSKAQSRSLSEIDSVG